jgi:hypothetical protein
MRRRPAPDHHVLQAVAVVPSQEPLMQASRGNDQGEKSARPWPKRRFAIHLASWRRSQDPTLACRALGMADDRRPPS